MVSGLEGIHCLHIPRIALWGLKALTVSEATAFKYIQVTPHTISHKIYITIGVELQSSSQHLVDS